MKRIADSLKLGIASAIITVVAVILHMTTASFGGSVVLLLAPPTSVAACVYVVIDLVRKRGFSLQAVLGLALSLAPLVAMYHFRFY